MEIKPHPEKSRRAIVTVEDRGEVDQVVGAAGLGQYRSLSLTCEYFGLLDSGQYPRDIDISRRQLGRLAGNALSFPTDGPTTEGLDLARQVISFVEEEQQAPMPPAH